jgi:hypothetical protein
MCASVIDRHSFATLLPLYRRISFITAQHDPGSLILALGNARINVTNRASPVPSERKFAMKLLIEVLIALILHPLAVLLTWIHLARRSDLDATRKLLWAVISLVWGIGPILYILLADGELW